MYGSILRAKLKPGRKEEYLRLMEQFVPSAEQYGKGLHSVEIAFEDKDPDRIAIIFHFRDKASYIASAESSSTPAEFFDGEPEWIDLNYEKYAGKPLGRETGARA